MPPKSTLGKAIGYSLRQWEKLVRYIDHGQLQIDNNRVEHAVKPFVIKKKYWLFANTQCGAYASTVLYSIVEKANGLMPFDYLRYVMAELPNESEDIDHLLPWMTGLTQKTENQ